MKTILTLICLVVCLKAQAGWMWTGAVSSAWNEIPQNAGSGPDLTTGGSFTMSCWIMRSLDRGSTRAVIISKGQTQPAPLADSISYDWAILTNTFTFRYTTIGGGVVHTWAASTPAPGTNQLAHIALSYTFGTAASITMYINGTNSSGAWVVGTGAVVGTNGPKTTMFGQDGFGTPLMGFMNDIAIWTSILSPREILDIYNARLKGFPLTVSRSTLVGYWPMDGWPEYTQEVSDSIPFLINGRADFSEPYRWYGSFEGLGGRAAVNERMFSYQPNE
jgi:hypothetical protein